MGTLGGHRGTRLWRRRSAASLATLLCMLASQPGGAVNYEEDIDPDWGYSGDAGPEHWADIRPAYQTCKTGRSQSPIDISLTHPLAYIPLSFQYRSQLLEIINSGNGVHVISPPGSALVVRGEAFDLEEVNFHVPGEHLFNGLRPEGELQLVHRDRQGNFVIVAVPLQTGDRENRILSRILSYFPMKPGEHVRHRQVGINPLFLLPTGRSYFRYEGSLTTPPCTEPVRWYVIDEPLVIAPQQLRLIAQAIHGNVRPVQPLNGRVVQAMRR